ncbi:MAG: hypothetical protein WA130_10460 [Candidatus Methanoperedens sp.]
MKVIRIDDVDKIKFDNIKAEFKTCLSNEAECNVKEISTLKDSSFLNLLLEVWKNTAHEEIVEKLSESKMFNNFRSDKKNEQKR